VGAGLRPLVRFEARGLGHRRSVCYQRTAAPRLASHNEHFHPLFVVLGAASEQADRVHSQRVFSTALYRCELRCR